AAEVHTDAVDAHDVHLAASQGLAPDGHNLSGSVLHADVHGVGVDVGLHLIGSKREGKAPLVGNAEGVPNAQIIGGETHDTAQQGPVRAVAVVGLGKGAVEGKVHLLQRRRQ